MSGRWGRRGGCHLRSLQLFVVGVYLPNPTTGRPVPDLTSGVDKGPVLRVGEGGVVILRLVKSPQRGPRVMIASLPLRGWNALCGCPLAVDGSVLRSLASLSLVACGSVPGRLWVACETILWSLLVYPWQLAGISSCRLWVCSLVACGSVLGSLQACPLVVCGSVLGSLRVYPPVAFGLSLIVCGYILWSLVTLFAS